jgi:glycosyltransferase involved in cell wall biosynthesis
MMDYEARYQLRAFCVIVPMYNEEGGAELCVRRICSSLAGFRYASQLIVVNDGSYDRTGPILDRLALELPNLTVIHHPQNAGYGAALRTGIRKAAEAGFDYALFMDSDLTNDPADIPKFVALMERGVDVIKASRFISGGGMRGVPWQRTIFSRSGNRVARMLFRVGLRDCTNGFRAVRVPILARMRLRESGFPIIAEELYWSKFLARSFAEVPVTLTDRSAQLRPTSFVYRPSIFYHYLKYPVKAFLGLKPRALASGLML